MLFSNFFSHFLFSQLKEICVLQQQQVPEQDGPTCRYFGWVAKHLPQTSLCWPCTPCPLCMGWGCGPLLGDGAGSWGHQCLRESHMVSAGVWHSKCESVWQPPQARGRWDPKVSPHGRPSAHPPSPLESSGAVPLLWLLRDPLWLHSSYRIARVFQSAPRQVWGLLTTPGTGGGG